MNGKSGLSQESGPGLRQWVMAQYLYTRTTSRLPIPGDGLAISAGNRRLNEQGEKRNTDEYSRWGRVGEANKVLEERVQRSGC